MNQGKLEVVKQEMARVNIDILGISDNTYGHHRVVNTKIRLSIFFEAEGNGNPFQYSCLGNPMDRGAWRVTVCEVA